MAEDKSVWGIVRSAWDATVGRTLVSEGTIDRNHGTANDLNAQVKQQRQFNTPSKSGYVNLALPGMEIKATTIQSIFSNASKSVQKKTYEAYDAAKTKAEAENQPVPDAPTGDPKHFSVLKEVLGNEDSRKEYAQALSTQIKLEGQRLFSNLEGKSLQDVGQGIFDTFKKAGEDGKPLWADRVGVGAGLGIGAVGVAGLLNKGSDGKRHVLRNLTFIGAGVVTSFAAANGLGNSMREVTGALNAMAGRAGQAR